MKVASNIQRDSYLQLWHQIPLCLFLNKICDPVRLWWRAACGGLNGRSRKNSFTFLQQSSRLLSFLLLVVCEPAQCSTYQTQRLTLRTHTHISHKIKTTDRWSEGHWSLLHCTYVQMGKLGPGVVVLWHGMHTNTPFQLDFQRCQLCPGQVLCTRHP